MMCSDASHFYIQGNPFRRLRVINLYIMRMTSTERQHIREGVRIAGRVLKYTLPLLVSAAMVLWLFHKVDFDRITGIMHRGVDYRYIVAMMAVTLLSHCIRGIRWGIQLRAAGVPRIPVTAECVSILGAYALNLVFPFAGEAWRCIYITRRERVPLSTVVGTDIGDRATDGVVIGLLIVLALFVAHPAIERFLDSFPLGETIARYSSDGVIVIWIAAAVAVLGGAAYAFRRSAFVQGIVRSARRIYDGFVVLFRMKDRGMYAVLTIGIWTCYFSETYLCFYAFPFTRELISQPGTCHGLIPGLLVFVFGSCSMIVPSNGGLGPWNIAVMFALTLCGVGQADATAYSIVCWSFQAATLIAAGIFSAIYVMCDKREAEAQAQQNRTA